MADSGALLSWWSSGPIMVGGAAVAAWGFWPVVKSCLAAFGWCRVEVEHEGRQIQTQKAIKVTKGPGGGDKSIEITEEMLTAGERVVAQEWCILGTDVASDLARDVFTAMWLAKVS